MKKGVKTTLIVALSLFCTGVVISLAVSLAVGFDFTRLNVSGNLWGQNPPDYITSENGTEREAVTEPMAVENSFKNEGQDFSIELLSSDVVLTLSKDDEIHIKYYENNWLWYDFTNENGKIKLVERHPKNILGNLGFGFSFNFDFFGIFEGDQNSTTTVEISLPAKFGGDFDLDSVSGNIKMDSVGTGRITASTTSGDIAISRLQGTGEMLLNTVSGDIKLSDVSASSLQLQTTSGDIKLTKTISTRTDANTTSGDVKLNMSEIDELIVNTVSGELEGVIAGKGDNYSVFFSSVSGSNSLRSHRGNGDKTIDFTSVSGDLDLRFSNGGSYDQDDDYDEHSESDGYDD